MERERGEEIVQAREREEEEKEKEKEKEKKKVRERERERGGIWNLRRCAKRADFDGLFELEFQRITLNGVEANGSSLRERVRRRHVSTFTLLLSLLPIK